MQCQADITAAPVQRPVCVESTAMGAAYLAGLAVGYWENMDEIHRNWAVDRTFIPELDEELRREKTEGWTRAVQQSFGWAR